MLSVLIKKNASKNYFSKIVYVVQNITHFEKIQSMLSFQSALPQMSSWNHVVDRCSTVPF